MNVKFYLKWTAAVILFMPVLAFIIIHALTFSFESPDYAIDDYFNEKEADYKIHRSTFGDIKLRYVEAGVFSDSVPLLLFIHGAPGNWDAFKQYLTAEELTGRYRMVSMDRIAYGDSAPGRAESDIIVHSESAMHILQQFANQKKFIVSHSYGSPISAVMAARDSTINGLIMCAPVNDPESEPNLWYAHLANLKIMRFLMPDYIDTATTEKMSHKEALEKILPVWDDVHCPVLHYHGTCDPLAPYEENVAFSRKHFEEEQLTVVTEKGGKHLLIWFKQDIFKELILAFVEKHI